MHTLDVKVNVSNNYVSFANRIFRIIRINSDNTVKVINSLFIKPNVIIIKELGIYNIRVNAVAPGVVETDMMSIVSEEMKTGYERDI